jgi:hypothetical protein
MTPPVERAVMSAEPKFHVGIGPERHSRGIPYDRLIIDVLRDLRINEHPQVGTASQRNNIFFINGVLQMTGNI